jgi:hypothetical protein
MFVNAFAQKANPKSIIKGTLHNLSLFSTKSDDLDKLERAFEKQEVCS